MIVIIISINLLVVYLAIQVLSQSEVSALKMRQPLNIHSYQTYFNIVDAIENRYITPTFLNNRLTAKDFTLLMLLWWVTIAVFFMVFDLLTVFGLLLMLLLMLAPVFIIEKYLDQVDLSIDKGIFNLLSQINARMLKSEDIMRALQETEPTITNKHIFKIIHAFNRTIRLGIPPAQAFSRLQAVTSNEYLKYLFINIEIVYLRRGNVQELMRALENEYTSIQIEINKRKVALEHEKNMTLFSLSLVALTTIKIVKDNDYIWTFYRDNTLLIAALALFVLLGMGFAIKASMTKY